MGGYRHGLAGAHLEEAGLVVRDHRALALRQVEAGMAGPGSRLGKRESERLRERGGSGSKEAVEGGGGAEKRAGSKGRDLGQGLGFILGSLPV